MGSSVMYGSWQLKVAFMTHRDNVTVHTLLEKTLTMEVEDVEAVDVNMTVEAVDADMMVEAVDTAVEEVDEKKAAVAGVLMHTEVEEDVITDEAVTAAKQYATDAGRLATTPVNVQIRRGQRLKNTHISAQEPC